MLLSAVSVLVVAQSSSEIPEGLMNNPVWQKEREFYGNWYSGKHNFLHGVNGDLLLYSTSFLC